SIALAVALFGVAVAATPASGSKALKQFSNGSVELLLADRAGLVQADDPCPVDQHVHRYRSDSVLRIPLLRAFLADTPGQRPLGARDRAAVGAARREAPRQADCDDRPGNDGLDVQDGRGEWIDRNADGCAGAHRSLRHGGPPCLLR